MENTIKKITLSTFKSFITKNSSNLVIKNLNHFDGMTDGTVSDHSPFSPVDRSNWAKNAFTNTLGIRQLWLVGQSRDFFTKYEDELYTGIEWSNCCGNGIVAILK